MKIATCNICSKQLTHAGIRGHLRFGHDINDPIENDHFTVHDYIKSQEQANIHPIPNPQPFQNNNIPPVAQTSGDPFDLVEKQLTQLIRIKSLKQMVNDLDNPQFTKSPEQQKDTLSEVNKIMDLVSSIEKRVEDRLSVNIPEGTDPQDLITLELIKQLPEILKQKQNSIPQQTEAEINPSVIMKKFTNEEIIKKVPDYIKKAIQKDELTLNQVKQGLKDRGFGVQSDQEQQLSDVYNLIKNKKKK